MPTSLLTGLNAFQPISMARDHLGRILTANGLNPMQMWDRVTAMHDAGVPEAAVGILAGSWGTAGAISGVYYFAIRWVDNYGDVGNLSALAQATAASHSTISYTAIPTITSNARIAKRQIFRSLAGDPSVLYLDIELINDSVTTGTSTKTDATLAARTQLPILNADGSLHARRFGVPPSDKACLAAFKDRIWAAGDVHYDQGHASITFSAQSTGSISGATNATPIEITSAGHGRTTGQTLTISGVVGNTAANGTFIITVTGANTFTLDGTSGNGAYVSGGTWSTTFESGSIYGGGLDDDDLEGRSLWIRGAADAYQIFDITPGDPATFSATSTYHIGDTSDFEKYAISPAPADANKIYFTEVLEPLSWPTAQNYLSLSDDLGDFITGLMPHGAYLYVLKERHIYRLTYATVPNVDGEVALVASRGCVNHRCHVLVEDAAYLLDYDGIYAFNGGSVQPLSIPIQDAFRDGQINWGAKKWFHAAHDASEEVVRFFVALGDSYLPKHAICFNYRLNRWWTESFASSVGASCQATISGKQSPLYGCQHFKFRTPRGTLDGISGNDSTWRGTVTSALLTSFTDSAVTMPSGAVGASVCIVSGRGKGQTRQIASVSGGRANVNREWAILLDSTSVYQIGGVPWSVRLGKFCWPTLEGYAKRAATIYFKPATHASSLDFRRYLSFQTTPANFGADSTLNLLSTERDKPDAVIDMKHARTTGGETSYSAGFEKIDISESSDQRIPGDRCVSIEFRGVQGVDPVVIGQISLEGVKVVKRA